MVLYHLFNVVGYTPQKRKGKIKSQTKLKKVTNLGSDNMMQQL